MSWSSVLGYTDTGQTSAYVPIQNNQEFCKSPNKRRLETHILRDFLTKNFLRELI